MHHGTAVRADLCAERIGHAFLVELLRIERALFRLHEADGRSCPLSAYALRHIDHVVLEMGTLGALEIGAVRLAEEDRLMRFRIEGTEALVRLGAPPEEPAQHVRRDAGKT